MDCQQGRRGGWRWATTDDAPARRRGARRAATHALGWGGPLPFLGCVVRSSVLEKNCYVKVVGGIGCLIADFAPTAAACRNARPSDDGTVRACDALRRWRCRGVSGVLLPHRRCHALREAVAVAALRSGTGSRERFQSPIHPPLPPFLPSTFVCVSERRCALPLPTHPRQRRTGWGWPPGPMRFRTRISAGRVAPLLRTFLLWATSMAWLGTASSRTGGCGVTAAGWRQCVGGGCGVGRWLVGSLSDVQTRAASAAVPPPRLPLAVCWPRGWSSGFPRRSRRPHRWLHRGGAGTRAARQLMRATPDGAQRAAGAVGGQAGRAQLGRRLRSARAGM